MTGRKETGVRCIHLLEDYRCALFGDPTRPKVCSDFKAEEEFCGKDREEALKILYSLSDPQTPQACLPVGRPGGFRGKQTRRK
jgi:hypothetical protein